MIVAYKSTTMAGLERICKLANGTLQRAIANTTRIGIDKIEKILTHCPEISADWLITGNGYMLKDNPDKEVIIRTYADDGIPLVPINAMAGLFVENYVSVLRKSCDLYVIPSLKNADFIITVRGDSMSPKFISGDLIVCSFVKTTSFFQWGRAYVIDTEQGVLLKYVKPGQDKDHIILVSENKNYDPFVLNKRELRHLAIVLGTVRIE